MIAINNIGARGLMYLLPGSNIHTSSDMEVERTSQRAQIAGQKNGRNTERALDADLSADGPSIKDSACTERWRMRGGNEQK